MLISNKIFKTKFNLRLIFLTRLLIALTEKANVNHLLFFMI